MVLLAPAEQKLNINFSKGKANKHYKKFVNRIETHSFKASNGRVSFPTPFFSDAYQLNLAVLSQKKYNSKEMFLIFQSIIMHVSQTEQKI